MSVVFVHGVPDTYRLWDRVRHQLSRTDIVALALPGFNSPVPNGFTATKEEYVDWLIAQIEQQTKPVDLVGHDWGCILSVRVASLRPDLVRTWAAGSGPISSAYKWHDLAKIWQTHVVGEQWMNLDQDELSRVIKGFGVPAEIAMEMAGRVDGTMKDCILRLYRSAVNVGSEWEAGLADITAPGLVFWGVSDPACPVEFADRLGKDTKAQVVKLDCGHWTPIERPNEIAQILEQHWKLSFTSSTKGELMITQVNSKAVLEVADDPRLSRETKAFLQLLNSGGVPLETLPPLEARQVLVDAQAAVKVDLSGIEESEKTITADGYSITLNIVRPDGVTGTLPVFMFIHGGGWVLGDYPTHQRMVRDLVVLSGFAAVFVNYTRTPDAQYPQAINEIYAATKWVAEHGKEIGVDGKNLAIVGNSVGGNMTAVTTLMAKAKGVPQIKLQVLMWPIVDADFETNSYHQFGEKRFLTTSLMKWMYDMYIPEPEKRKDIYASPLQATVEQLKDLPPALIQIAESDILHDEGEAYGRKLDEAGVNVTTVRYNGMIHDFGLLNGLAELPSVRSLFVHAAAELKKYLQ